MITLKMLKLKDKFTYPATVGGHSKPLVWFGAHFEAACLVYYGYSRVYAHSQTQMVNSVEFKVRGEIKEKARIKEKATIFFFLHNVNII